MKVEKKMLPQYVFIILVSAYYILKYTYYNAVGNILIAVSVPVFFLSIVYNCKTFKQLQRYIVILGIGIVVFVLTGEASVLLSCAILLSTNNIKERKFFNVLFVTYVSLVIFVIVMALTVGIGQMNSGIRDGAVRYALGFQHANRLAMILFIISQLYLLKNVSNNRQKNWIVFMLINFVNFELTRSNTILLLTVITLIMVVMQKNAIYIKMQPYIFLSIFPVMLNGAYYGIIHKDEGIWKVIDTMMSYRLTWGRIALNDINISLFPQHIRLSNIVDCGVIVMLFKVGVIGVFLYWLLYFLYWKKFYWQTPYEIIIFIMISVLYAFSEDITLIISYNPALVCLAKVVWNDEHYGRIKEKKKIIINGQI